ncbi:hypothetical protein ACJ3XI_05445 [Litorimonas sp. RW-G-Af-16]
MIKRYLTMGLMLAGSAAALSACLPKSVGDGMKLQCFPAVKVKMDQQLATYRGAMFIDVQSDGSYKIGYQNEAFEKALLAASNKKDMAKMVLAAGPESIDYQKQKNPLDINVSSNTTVAFRITSKNAVFTGDGFKLRDPELKEGEHSPFGVYPRIAGVPAGQLVLVDFDRANLTPPNKCDYEYDLEISGATTVDPEPDDRPDPDPKPEPTPEPEDNQKDFQPMPEMGNGGTWGNGFPPSGGPNPG